MNNKFYQLLAIIIFIHFFSCDANPIVSNFIESKTENNLTDTISVNNNSSTNCEQLQCQVWAKVNIAKQQMYLYSNGNLVYTFQVTTGDAKHKTPLMNRYPSGPMFVKYTSKKFPGGNYMGLGNMPYVVFIKGGYAIHGTTEGNIKLLGKKVSHGCIRLHPDNAKLFYEMIQMVGMKNVWITVEK
jgi:lipoprotein-anchoring transpeptidase ErfK/SrfK